MSRAATNWEWLGGKKTDFRIQLCPHGGGNTLANLTTSQAALRLLDWLCEGIPVPEVLQPNQTQPMRTRNEEIRKRYAVGETLIAIAKDHGISKQRVHQIITGE